ncbi:ABC transporter ATP-binding protein [Desulfobacula toluolica]|uniref:MdlB: multidrug resistance ABC transporter, ATP-binding/permease protein n=1 Tax=Desulfobacula toluolica (strain DSM 7467 / Tol2) TaxID=651182 RepID=K0NTA2_DESTT|nr:ABC transporter ATP-binding protein [Desulfobacula toluolica]CCK82292.1 MdlB: multidrug resistance ABC transporter, ATP-binding/permease protein [Desulfobacula toluolica Tol2]
MNFPDEESLDKPKDIRLLKRFFPFIMKRKLMVTVSVALVMAISALDLAMPYVTRIAVDRYIVPGLDFSSQRDGIQGEGSPPALAVEIKTKEMETVILSHPGLFERQGNTATLSSEHLDRLTREEMRIMRAHDLRGTALVGLVLLAIAGLRFLFSFVQIMVMEYTGQWVMHDLRLSIYRHIQRLPVSFFDKNTVGRLSTRVTNDVQNMQELFTSIITFVMKDSFMLLGILGVLVYMDLKLAAAILSVIPFVFLAAILFSRKSRKVFRVLRIKVAQINSMFSEAIGGMKVIQLFTMEKKTLDDFRKINRENYDAGLQQIRIYGLFMPVIDMLGSFTLAIVIFYGGGRVVSELVSLGILVAFISYIKMFFRPIRDIAEKHNILQNALASGERIVQILDKKLHGEGGSKELERLDTLSFDHVTMAYKKGKNILNNLSFDLKSGSSLAIVGPTGSGKTTLINLIVQFYKPKGGRILINGDEIDRYSVRSIRSKIALVTQDPYLFTGTIRKNILPPEKDVSKEELNSILKLSNCQSIIDKMPEGLSTRISGGGASLSSGERQLISIARAFAHQPDLIIFDEATSYVDTESEEKIRIAVSNLKENRTSITIAHRLRSAVTSDQIIVIKDGRVIEKGSHITLMKNRQFYYGLHQANGLKKGKIADTM